MKNSVVVFLTTATLARSALLSVRLAEEKPPSAPKMLRPRPPELDALRLRGRPRASLAVTVVGAVPSSDLAKVTHNKDAGGGYTEGSPLYAKQQQWKKQQKENPTKEKAAGEEKEQWCEKGSFWEKWLPESYCSAEPDDYTYKKVVWDHFGQHCITAVLQIVVVLLCAYCYKTAKAHSLLEDGMQYKSEYEPKTSWAYSFFSCDDCGQDWPLCCMAFCCPVIRWADTISNTKVGLLSFWPAVITLAVLYALGPLTAGVSVAVLTCFMIYSRQRIRRVFGHNDGTCDSWCFDIFAWCFCCWCCATVQEAREVDKVRRPTFAARL